MTAKASCIRRAQPLTVVIKLGKHWLPYLGDAPIFRVDLSLCLLFVVAITHTPITGTSSIVDEKTHEPLLPILTLIVDTAVKLRKEGHRVVIVSSGAIGVGLRRMDVDRRPKHLAQLQVRDNPAQENKSRFPSKLTPFSLDRRWLLSDSAVSFPSGTACLVTWISLLLKSFLPEMTLPT